MEHLVFLDIIFAWKQRDKIIWPTQLLNVPKFSSLWDVKERNGESQMKEVFLIAQELICLSSAFWHVANLFPTALPINYLQDNTILSIHQQLEQASEWAVYPHYCPWSPLKWEKEGRKKRHCPCGSQEMATITYHTIEIVTAKPNRRVPRADTCSVGSGSIGGSPDSWLSPPQSLLSPSPPWVHPCPWFYSVPEHPRFCVNMGWPWTSRLIMISHGPLSLFDPLWDWEVTHF